MVWKMLDEQAAGGSDLFREKGTEVLILFVAWLKGKQLTTRADEPERRALAALQVLDGNSGLDHFTHYAAQAILALPDAHPLRDLDKVRAAVHSQLLRFTTLGDETPWIFAASALGLAYEEHLVADEELTAWEPWAETIAAHLDPDDAAGLWGSVEAFYLDLAERDGSRWREFATRARNRIDPSQLSPRERSLSDLGRLRTLIDGDDQSQVAEQLKEALESGTLNPGVERMMAVKEARVRLGLEQFERVLTLLEPRLDQYEEAYVTAIRTEDREERGDEFCEACMTLAFARAALNRWEDAVEAIERGKCARQRYLRALRRTPRAAELLELEAELYAISRGLPPGRATRTVARVQDWLAQGLSPEAELQEQYRQLIPTLDASTWRAPRLSDIQEGLREGEAALSLGLSWPGLMAAVIVRGRPACLHTIRRPEVTEAILAEYLSSNENGEDGFMVALERADGEEGPRKTLARLLEFLDEAIGRPVADALRDQGITRLVVIPHRFLRLTPLWALTSWVDLDVRIVPAASTLAESDSGQAMARSALVVTNPTLNLQMAATEGAITTARLEDSHFEVRVLAGAEASEDAIVERVQGAGLLHFAGHGHAALTDGSLSALLVSPEWSRAGVESADALVAMANMDPDTPHVFIDQDEGSPHRKIYYEYAKEGTLFVDAMADTVGVAGELWRAGDILVSGVWSGVRSRFSVPVRAVWARSQRWTRPPGCRRRSVWPACNPSSVPAGQFRIRSRFSSQRRSMLARCRRMRRRSTCCQRCAALRPPCERWSGTRPLRASRRWRQVPPTPRRDSACVHTQNGFDPVRRGHSSTRSTGPHSSSQAPRRFLCYRLSRKTTASRRTIRTSSADSSPTSATRAAGHRRSPRATAPPLGLPRGWYPRRHPTAVVRLRPQARL
jgi:hypothetical protein